MQIKQGTSNKDTNSLLPSSVEETCGGEETPASCYHVHVKNYPGGTQSTEQKTCCADGSLPEKSPLTDVPLNSEQLASMYNRDAPPAYNLDPEMQGVWSTKSSKVHPGRPRNVSSNERSHLFCFTLLFILSIALGAYLCASAIPTLVANYEKAHEIQTVQSEALQAVNVVEDLDNIPPEYEGKLIHVTGLISVDEPLNYTGCGISARSIKLKQLYDYSYMFLRFDDEQDFMSNKWPNVRLGSDQFCENTYFESEDEKIAAVARIGPLELGHRIKEKFDEYYVISEKLRLMGTESAYRVAYVDSGRHGQEYSVLGKLENGVIRPYDLLDYYTIILQRKSRVSAERMIRDRVYHRMITIDAENRWSYMMIAMGMSFSLIASFFFVVYIKETKKTRRNHVMLSMPLQ